MVLLSVPLIAAHHIQRKNPPSEKEGPYKQMQKAPAADNNQGLLKPIELMGHMCGKHASGEGGQLTKTPTQRTDM